MRTLRTSRFLALVLPLSAAGLILSHSSAALHAQSAAPNNTADDVTYNSGSSRYLSAPHTMEFYHGVQFGQGDATMRTDNAVILLDKDNNLLNAKAPGPVHLYDPEDDLTGQHGTVDFTKHIATLTDNIVLVVKPGKHEANSSNSSPRRQFKDPATLTCAEMTYDYKHKIGRIPGPLTVTQTIQTKDDGLQTRVLTADAGLYNGKAETIQLVGDIKGTYSDGSVIQGDTRPKGKPVLINIKEGAEEIDVPFDTKGHFTVKQPSKNSKNDSDDDDADLTLPVPPPHTPGPGEAPAAPKPTPPAALTAPAAPVPPSKTPPNQTPASPAAVPTQPAQVPPASVQTPPAAAAPAGSP